MRKLTYTFTLSLDGYIERDGTFGWAAPDAEVHQFYNDLMRETGTMLYGRRLYELMNGYWPTGDQDPDATREMVEYAKLWRATPIVVFSRTLTSVEGNATLFTGDAVAEVARLKSLPGKDLALGGAGLAASLMPHGLIDEYRLVVCPSIVGGGTPFFPALAERIDLRLVETRTFGSGMVYLRYATMSG
jgi:dihydrofolate reductase